MATPDLTAIRADAAKAADTCAAWKDGLYCLTDDEWQAFRSLTQHCRALCDEVERLAERAEFAEVRADYHASRVAELELALREIGDNCGCQEDANPCANCLRVESALASAAPPTPSRAELVVRIVELERAARICLGNWTNVKARDVLSAALVAKAEGGGGMIATAFDEETGVLDAPPGVSPEDCTMLSVFQGETGDGTPVVISCWKPTTEEWEEMRKTGRVWLIVCGRTMPPVALSGQTPFGYQ